MARVVGLDLGAASVKVAVVETSFRNPAQRTSFAVPRTAEGGLPAALAELAAQGALLADTVVVGYPGFELATHTFTLPFNAAKKVDAAAAFEVEAQLPVDASEVAFDFQVTPASDEHVNIVAGVVRRANLEVLLAELAAVKIDPRIVAHPALVYQAYLAQLQPSDGSVAFIDIGHERVTVAIGTPQGDIEFARIFHGGGAALTAALASEFAISADAAREWKESQGALASAVVGPDAERGADAMMRALAPVLREIRTTFKSYQAHSHQEVSRVLLCGGTSKLRGLSEQFAGALDVPCALLQLRAPWEDVAPEGMQALALALRGQGGPKTQRFNLRSGPYAFKGDFAFMRARMGQMVALAFALLVLIVGGGMARVAILERRDSQMDALICSLTLRVLGRCEKNAEVAIASLGGDDSSGRVDLPARSAFALLSELHAAIPKGVAVTMDQVTVDLQRISVRCEAQTTSDIETFVAQVGKNPCFSHVTEGKVERSRDGKKMSFRLEIDVACPDDPTSKDVPAP